MASLVGFFFGGCPEAELASSSFCNKTQDRCLVEIEILNQEHQQKQNIQLMDLFLIWIN